MRCVAALLLFAPLFGAVQSSIIPDMDHPPPFWEDQINSDQIYQMSLGYGIPLRVMSFNMLSNLHERKFSKENRWACRKSRVVEYLEYAHPDIIGSQELQKDQQEYLLEQLGEKYASVGKEAVFYNKERISVVSERMTSEVFEVVEMEDQTNGAHFVLINTHFSFSRVEKRLAQAKALAKLIKETDMPLVITGDFNTFPMRPELTELPFYDGDYIVNLIESAGVKDARKLAVKGQYGLITTTTLCPFESDEIAGVILDHIFVSPWVVVKTHGIDPAKVDDLFTSDHFPVISDIVIAK